MKIALLEDEKPAMRKLQRMLEKIPHSNEVVATLSSVKEALDWWETTPEVHLMISDIRLSDGLSFDFFKAVNFEPPVIFVTAYDEYAIEAFSLHSIGYLLKPVSQTALEEAIEKFYRIKKGFKEVSQAPPKNLDWEQLQQLLSASQQKKYQERFMVKVGEHIRSVATSDIAYFFAEGRNAFLISSEGKKYNLDYKLEDLELILDPASFYRTNRSFIVQFSAIRDVLVYSGSRLKIETQPTSEKEILVSREKVNGFKDWFNGKVD